ncbi:hypothetical protein ACFLXB_06880 [Chloroflexota bacterium]
MPVERSNCPSCGGTLSFGEKDKQATCSYCSTTVEIKRGSDGPILTNLKEISADGEYFVLQREIEKIETAIFELHELRSRKVAEHKSPGEKSRGVAKALIIPILVIGVIDLISFIIFLNTQDYSSLCIGIFMFFFLLWAIFSAFKAPKKFKQGEVNFQSAIRVVEKDIEDLERKMEDLRSKQMDLTN